MPRKQTGNSLLASRYADAVFSLGKAQKSLVLLESDIAIIRHFLDISPELNKVFRNPTLSKKTLSDVLEKLFKKSDLSPLSLRLVKILAENGRISIISSVLNMLENRIKEDKGEAKASITSAVELSDKQLKNIEKSLEKQMDKKITVEAHVTPEILGGLIIKIGSKMLDNSIRGKLEQLRTRRLA